MAKSKREEKVEEAEGTYEFKLPDFDEQAFIRREVLSARASFITLGIGALAGVIATALWMFAAWQWGFLPLVAGIVALRPILMAMGFPEDVTKPRALIGSYFMLFFTGLSVWVLGVNVVPAP